MSSPLLKLAEDYVLGTALCVAAIPLFTIIALAIKLDSPGPILFRQRRGGVHGRRFTIYKFRSMAVTADDDAMASCRHCEVTRVGRVLRATRLDELPQLVNVLQGRMSLVGLRPHAVVHNEYYGDLIDGYLKRHRVKPGLTGWAQVHGLNGEAADVAVMKRRLELDLYYIEHWSLWLDLAIIARTPLALMQGTNEPAARPLRE